MTFPSWVLVCKLINKVFSEERCWERGARGSAWALPAASNTLSDGAEGGARPHRPRRLWLPFSRLQPSAAAPLAAGAGGTGVVGVARLLQTAVTRRCWGGSHLGGVPQAAFAVRAELFGAAVVVRAGRLLHRGSQQDRQLLRRDDSTPFPLARPRGTRASSAMRVPHSSLSELSCTAK